MPAVFMNNAPIPMLTDVKCLGVLLNEMLNDDIELSKQVNKLYARCNTVLRKFRKCSADVKKQLFVSFCTNVYCSSLWCRSSSSALKKVKVAYNNVFRSLFNLSRRSSASSMFAENNVLGFDALCRKNIFNFMSRVSESTNSLVSTLCNSIEVCSDYMYAWYVQWQAKLFTPV